MVLILSFCRGGDDTQREAASGLPLESLGAANQVCSYIQGNILDVTALNGHPCPTSLCSSSMMNIREYYLSLRHLIQADLALVDRGGDFVVMPLVFKVVIPEVSDREFSELRSCSSIKTLRG